MGPATDASEVLLLTHWHPDHAGSAAEIGAWPGTEVWVHDGDAAVVRGEQVGPAPDLTDAEAHRRVEDTGFPAAHVDRTFTGDGPLGGLPAGFAARAAETPGHTDGSVAFVFPRHRTLVTGDIVAHQHGEVVLGPYDVDRRQAGASAARLTRSCVDPDRQLERVCFGHGAPLHGAQVDRFVDAIARRLPAFRFDEAGRGGRIGGRGSGCGS